MPFAETSRFERRPLSEATTPREKAQKLKYALKRSVNENPADALLLSGGIDSGFLAALDPQTPAITVVLEGQGVDAHHAQKLTDHLGTPWHLIEISQEQAANDLRDIMGLVGTWDIGILNDVPIYEGLKYAASRGWRKVRTGDESDTLFAGYSYLQEDGFDIKTYLKNLIPQMRLASSRVGKAMEMQMVYPYLHPEVLEMAQELELSDNVAIVDTSRPGDFHTRDQVSEGGQKWGKIVLRNAAYGLIPENLIWRTKTDLEYGSGMYTLEDMLADSLTPEEEEYLRTTGKHFWNKAHGKLYLQAEEAGVEAKAPGDGEYGCGWCGGGVVQGKHHCGTCGGYPANEPPSNVFNDESIITP
jgi:asparagine synthase (glutamine-hydrolysing)